MLTEFTELWVCLHKDKQIFWDKLGNTVYTDIKKEVLNVKTTSIFSTNVPQELTEVREHAGCSFT